MKGFLLERLLPLVGLLVTAAIAFYATRAGMASLQELRQLERVPASFVGAILPGETNTRGAVRALRTIPSKYTNTASVYYYFTREQEERDSDGDTRWVTRESGQDAVDFVLQDQTGSIQVLAGRDRRTIDWQVYQRYQETRGDQRYTEWRLQPGDTVFTFAMAQVHANGLGLEFAGPGDFSPIISVHDAQSARQDMGGSGVFFLWAGLAATAFTIYCVSMLFGIHRVWQYQLMLTLVLSLLVTQLGLSMLRADMSNGVERQTLRQEQAQRIFDSGFANGSRLSVENASLARITLAAGHARLADQFARFPDNLLASAWGLSVPQATIQLTGQERQVLDRQGLASVSTSLDGTIAKILSVLAAALTLVFSWLGFRQIRFKRLIENVPTQHTLGVVPGISEVVGTISLPESVEPLTGPLSNSACSWFDYLVEERRGSGKNARWVTLEHRCEQVPFLCVDDEGGLYIDPSDAQIITRHKDRERKGKIRYTEKSLRLDDPLYAIGGVSPDEASQRGIAMSGGAKDLGWPFILSNLTERQVMLGKSRWGLLFLNLAFSSLVLAGLLLLASAGSFSPYDFLLAALLAPAYMLLFMIALHYNDIIFLQQRAFRNWSNIETALKKRKNLIPAWEAVVKAHLEHEGKLHERLAQLRGSNIEAIHEADSAAEYFDREHAALAELRARVEDYPDLESNQHVADMMMRISHLETEIALLRQGYNNSVTYYNTRVQTFPDMILAKLFKFEQMTQMAVQNVPVGDTRELLKW